MVASKPPLSTLSFVMAERLLNLLRHIPRRGEQACVADKLDTDWQA